MNHLEKRPKYGVGPSETDFKNTQRLLLATVKSVVCVDKMTKRLTFKLLWLMTIVSISAWTMNAYHAQALPQLKVEILFRHEVVMLLLTLPSGLIFTSLISSAVGLTGFELTGMTYVFFVSFTCGIAGYWQWLFFIPWLWRKWKLKNKFGHERLGKS